MSLRYGVRAAYEDAATAADKADKAAVAAWRSYAANRTEELYAAAVAADADAEYAEARLVAIVRAYSALMR